MRPVCGSGLAEATALTTVRRPTPYLRSSARPDSAAGQDGDLIRVEVVLGASRMSQTSSGAFRPEKPWPVCVPVRRTGLPCLIRPASASHLG
jgi:hypothetical protein